jgi:hypothetical protein
VKDNSDNHGGIFIEKSRFVLINNSYINHNGIGINIEHANNITINNLCISNNTHFGILIRDQSKDVTIHQCNLINNFRYGIYCHKESKVSIQRSNFINNYLFGLYSIEPVLQLEKNWWGSSFGPSILPYTHSDRVSNNNYLCHYRKWNQQPYDTPKITYQESRVLEPSPFYSTERVHHFQGVDLDNDKVPDWWEKKWGYTPTVYQNHANMDEDQDGLNNIEECYTDKWGSSPYHKDIFLEIDWMETNTIYSSNKPSAHLLEKLVNTFKKHGINLHIDDGRLGQGGQIPKQNSSSFSNMIDIYWNNFLNNELKNPKKGIFHYVIICDVCADISYPFFGWDHFDSIAISAELAKEISPQYSRQMIIVGGILHQLGSSLGLLVEKHQGNDNLQASIVGSIDWFIYRSYKSSMNYLYKYRILSFSDGNNGYGDFNDWENLNFSFFKDSSFQLLQK